MSETVLFFLLGAVACFGSFVVGYAFGATKDYDKRRRGELFPGE